MIKYLFIFLFIPQIVFGAEFLVVAKHHWKDNWTVKQVRELSSTGLQKYNYRTQVGDILMVEPDGWKWGNQECLPDYLIVKVPSISYSDAKHYMDSLQDPANPALTIKKRKYRLPESWVDSYVNLNQTVVNVTLTTAQQELISSIIEKTQ